MRTVCHTLRRPPLSPLAGNFPLGKWQFAIRQARDYLAHLQLVDRKIPDRPVVLAIIKRIAFLRRLDELADEYGTSRLSTAIRCVDLSDFPLVLVCHSDTGRRWFRRAASVPERWFPSADLDPSSAAFPVQLGGMNCARVQSISAAAWFDCRDANAFWIEEETVKSHRNETLTVLMLDTKMIG